MRLRVSRLQLAVLVGALAIAAVTPATALAAPAPAKEGTVIAVNSLYVTIQTGGRRIGVINALTDAANRITRADFPYVWGGGHAQAGVASIGEKGPGYNGHRRGFDCSGSVAAVLAGAGLWQPGSGVPADNGVISQLRSEHLIARHAGTAADSVNLYDDPGVHIFMSIDGRFFGTSDGGGGGDKKGGAGWLDDGAPDASDRAFKRYHFLPSVLHNRTAYGDDYTFELSPELIWESGIQRGDRLRITYRTNREGELLGKSVTFVGAVSTTGVVTAVTSSKVTITTPAGVSKTFSTGLLPQLLEGVIVGDTVQISSTKVAGVLTAHTLVVTAPPTTPPVNPNPPGDGNPGQGNPPGGY